MSSAQLVPGTKPRRLTLSTAVHCPEGSAHQMKEEGNNMDLTDMQFELAALRKEVKAHRDLWKVIYEAQISGVEVLMIDYDDRSAENDYRDHVMGQYDTAQELLDMLADIPEREVRSVRIVFGTIPREEQN